MKTSLLKSVLLLAAALIAGCASDGSNNKPAQTRDERPPEQRLKVGMTKEEVRAALGEPGGTQISSDGLESWTYKDTAKAFIPFYTITGGKFQFLSVNFGPDGKVKNWSSNKQGLY